MQKLENVNDLHNVTQFHFGLNDSARFVIGGRDGFPAPVAAGVHATDAAASIAAGEGRHGWKARSCRRHRWDDDVRKREPDVFVVGRRRRVAFHAARFTLTSRTTTTPVVRVGGGGGGGVVGVTATTAAPIAAPPFHLLHLVLVQSSAFNSFA